MADTVNPPQARLRVDALMDGAIIRLTLDAPPGNVLDRQMIGQLDEALSSTLGSGARLLLLEGAGSHFSFGASVAEHVRELAGELIPGFHRMLEKLLTIRVPTAALVRGQCLGGGLELAATADYLFVEDGAKLGVPEIKLAVFPPMACVTLPWRVGGARALEMITTGRSLDASEAMSWGLATRRFEPDKGVDGAIEWVAKQLCPLSGAALGFAVRAAREPLLESVRDRLPGLERLYLRELMETADANEGIASFLERRKPLWRNA